MPACLCNACTVALSHRRITQVYRNMSVFKNIHGLWSMIFSSVSDTRFQCSSLAMYFVMSAHSHALLRHKQAHAEKSPPLECLR